MVLLLSIATLSWPMPATGQAPPGPPADTVAAPDPDPDPDPVATLGVWAEDVWLDLLDREGTVRGRLAAEGVFQRFHPLMDDEYELDRRTGLFTAAEDVAWHRSEAALRGAGASVSHPHIMNRVDWRQRVPIAGAVDLLADYRRDHSFTDERDHVRLGVVWRDVAGSGWSLWTRLGVHFFKPGADLELGGGRSWTDADGMWHLEARVAALDAFNDLIFGTLGVAADEVDAHLDYRRAPFALRVAVERRGSGWRGEVHAGATTESRAHVTFPATDAPSFVLDERAAFLGALVEVRPVAGLAVAGQVRGKQAVTERRWEGGGDLRVRERTGSGGLHLRWRLRPALHARGEVEVVFRPEDRGGVETVDHDDREVFGALALVRSPAEGGWTGRLAYAVLDRDAGALLPGVEGRNHRLVTEGGHRFASGFEVTVGLRWDLDALGRNTFDGAHLRLATPLP